jgi:hypothetical protein
MSPPSLRPKNIPSKAASIPSKHQPTFHRPDIVISQKRELSEVK